MKELTVMRFYSEVVTILCS